MMIYPTNDIELVRPLFERYMWHMKGYFQIDDVQGWIHRANDYFELYKTDSNRFLYVLSQNDELLGFAMVNDACQFISSGNSIAEFYIVPEKKRNSLGTKLAEYAFSQIKGKWEVCVASQNAEGLSFWKKVICNFTDGDFQIKRKATYDGSAFIFNTV